MSVNDGGSAFPEISTDTSDKYGNDVTNVYSSGGMTLRDYFAGQVVAGIFASGRQVDVAKEVITQQRALEMGLRWAQIATETNKLIASMSYQVADAMLAERDKDQG